MDATVKPILEIDQALADIQNWLENHARKTDEEEKSLTLAERIVDLYLVNTYLEDEDNDMENYDSDVLFGYAFYLSKDKDFSFTRTFLNDKAEAYIKNRKHTRDLFAKVIMHFNEVVRSLDKKLRAYRVQYNDLYVFLYDNKEKRWKARIKYGKLGNIVDNRNTIFQICQKTKYISTNELVYTGDMKAGAVEAVSELSVILG